MNSNNKESLNAQRFMEIMRKKKIKKTSTCLGALIVHIYLLLHDYLQYSHIYGPFELKGNEKE